MDGIITLIKDGERTYDEYGNEVIETTEREVFVTVRGVYQSEFYNAAQNGLRPSITFFIRVREDYEGETDVVYEGRQYSVIRADWTFDGVNLICEEKINE